jgi:hypothetical protein
MLVTAPQPEQGAVLLLYIVLRVSKYHGILHGYSPLSRHHGAQAQLPVGVCGGFKMEDSRAAAARCCFPGELPKECPGQLSDTARMHRYVM